VGYDEAPVPHAHLLTVDEGLPRGEWEEYSNPFTKALHYAPRPMGNDEACLVIQPTGQVYMFNQHRYLYLSPDLEELYPRNERDPEKQPIIVLETDLFLLL
jgi:hypothetical protein